MNQQVYVKELLSQYLSRKYEVVTKYFKGMPAGITVAEKMQRLTGLPQKYFRNPADWGMIPFMYCFLYIEEITEKLEKMGYELVEKE